MQFKAKYLGRYFIDYNPIPDSDDAEAFFYNELDEDDTYDIELFMRQDPTPDFPFHGHHGESNTSAIVCKFDDSCESAKLWRIY